jgi:hypothetical protein
LTDTIETTFRTLLQPAAEVNSFATEHYFLQISRCMTSRMIVKNLDSTFNREKIISDKIRSEMLRKV